MKEFSFSNSLKSNFKINNKKKNVIKFKYILKKVAEKYLKRFCLESKKIKVSSTYKQIFSLRKSQEVVYR